MSSVPKVEDHPRCPVRFAGRFASCWGPSAAFFSGAAPWTPPTQRIALAVPTERYRLRSAVPDMRHTPARQREGARSLAGVWRDGVQYCGGAKTV